MYEFYYFEKNTDPTGKHVIHRDSCTYLPSIDNRTVLSYDRSGLAALHQAETQYLGKSFCLCAFCYEKTKLN